eukprot:56433_1
MCVGKVEHFYHGMSDNLVFPHYTGEDCGSGIQPHCPLSTTKSIEVAANFANPDNGLIVQFSKTKHFLSTNSKYFAVSWLSDFSNESEYLFIQNKGAESLMIHNIFDPKFGYEYASIFEVVRQLQQLLNEKLAKYYECQISHPSALISLMEVIVENQLSYKLPKYRPFKTLTEYSRKICDAYFLNQTQLIMDHIQCEIEYPFIAQLFFCSKYGWLNIDVTNTLYPNITQLEMKKIDLCSSLLDRILKTTDKLINVKSIKIEPNEKCTLSVQESVDKYTEIFKRKHLFMSASIKENILWINRCEEVEFAEILIKDCGRRYFKETNSDIEQVINKLIGCGSDQQSLDQKQVCIDWENIRTNPNLGPFKQMYYVQYSWIKLDIITMLFPSMETLMIYNIRLFPFIFDDLLRHVCNRTTCLRYIWIILGEGESEAMRACAEQLMDHSKLINIYDNNDEQILLKNL